MLKQQHYTLKKVEKKHNRTSLNLPNLQNVLLLFIGGINVFFFLLEGIKDIPPSGVTRPICGIMGTVRLVAGISHIIMFHIQ